LSSPTERKRTFRGGPSPKSLWEREKLIFNKFRRPPLKQPPPTKKKFPLEKETWRGRC